MFVWWKSATHLFTIGYLWVCLAFLIQLLLHGFPQPQVRQHYFSPLSAFPLLFPLFMKSNWFFVFVFFATSNLLVFPGERLFKKSDLPLFSCKCAKENYSLWNREMNLLIVQNLTTRQFHIFIAFFYNRTLLRNSLSRNIKRVAYRNHIAVFLIEH